MECNNVLGGNELYLRIIFGFFPIILLVIFGTYIGVLKYKKRIHQWFIPIGFEVAFWTKVYSTKNNRIKRDYIIWCSFAAVALLYWFGSYFVVNLILLSNFQSFLYSHNSVYFEWENNFNFASGLNGRFNIKNGDNLNFLFSQVNVRNYLYEALTHEITVKCDGNLTNDAFYLGNKDNLLNPKFVEFLLNEKNPSQSDLSKYFVSVSSSDFVNIRDAGNLHMKLWLHSFLFSNVFLTPLCQFLSLMLPLSIICSYKRDYATFFAPYGILGGLVTLIGGVAFDDNVFISWQFILFENQGFYMYHTYILLLGGCWFIYCHRYSFSRILLLIAIMFSYLIYVMIVVNMYNIQFFTTGVTELDTTLGGSYAILQDIFPPGSPIKFPTTVFFMLLLFLSFMYIMIIIKNIIHKMYWKKVFHNNEQSIINDVRSMYFKFKNKWLCKGIKRR